MTSTRWLRAQVRHLTKERDALVETVKRLKENRFDVKAFESELDAFLEESLDDSFLVELHDIIEKKIREGAAAEEAALRAEDFEGHGEDDTG